MKHYLPQLEDLFQYAYHNTHSDFYRMLYTHTPIPTHIASKDDWRMIPPLTKRDILAVPFWSRIFTDRAGVDTIRNTSGTTGGSVLLVPRTKFTPYTYIPKGIHITGMLQFLATQHIYERQTSLLWPEAITVTGNVAELEQCVRMAAHLRINALQVFSFVIEALYPLLKKYGLAEHIELVEFMGERVTEGMWQKTRAYLPRATIIADYGSAELQAVAAAAYPETHPAHACEYVPQPTHLLELLEKESDRVITEPGIEGELTITTLWTENNPFPLIRYRSGDAATLVTIDNDPWNCTYNILGRINLDRIKITGGELRVEEFERVLKHYPELSDEFELHIYPETESQTLPQIELYVRPRDEHANLASIGEGIERELRVSPTFTYHEGVEHGFYPPLSVRPLAHTSKSKKTVRFFRH